VNKVETITMGCRLNAAESDALAAALRLAEAPDDAPTTIIINSCAVTNEAVRQTRQAIRRARKDNPDAYVVVTGCAVQTDPNMFRAMAEVTAVVGNAEKGNIANFMGLDRLNDPVRVSDIMAVAEASPHLVSSFSEQTRAFVEVQNGCDHRCTFCIIPFGRGPSRSVPAGAVIDKIKRLMDEGFAEIVLTGVDVTSYGHDLPGAPTLGHLVERILRAVPALPRLRLSSVDGVEIDDRLFDLLTAETRMMPHVHLSLQSGDNMILKRMKRRHSREQAIELVARMQGKRPDIAIGADIIAGFPTEDEAAFENSLRLVAEAHIVHGHIFPYSERNGTPAARMPQVPPQVRKARAAQLRNAVSAQKAQWQAMLVGTTHNLLVERDAYSGHAENFAHIRLESKATAGQIAPVRITRVTDGQLYGQLLEASPHDQ
jgi:threonylcarbamoyladenosine tRNA methylthiotransferase MtaB